MGSSRSMCAYWHIADDSHLDEGQSRTAVVRTRLSLRITETRKLSPKQQITLQPSEGPSVFWKNAMWDSRWGRAIPCVQPMHGPVLPMAVLRAATLGF